MLTGIVLAGFAIVIVLLIRVHSELEYMARLIDRETSEAHTNKATRALHRIEKRLSDERDREWERDARSRHSGSSSSERPE